MLNRPFLTIILLFIAAPAWGRSVESSSLSAGVAAFDTNIVWEIHDNGHLRSVVTNYGYFGTVRNRLRDSTGALVPVMESPPGSRVEYLYEAGLWIGGVVGGDTLVSTGSLGFRLPHELYADNPMPGVFSEFKGDEEWTFLYGDTTTDPETVTRDFYDGPHRPLPVRVRQTTSVLDASLARGGMFIELVITNVGSQPIDSMWMGWHIDPDIGHADRERYWLDDITGHSNRTVFTDSGSYELTFAWAMDNDGDPDSSGPYGPMSARHAIGSMYLGGSPRLTGESYNWWGPSLIKPWDWGPQRIPGDTNVFGGRGFEVTDRFRYRVLSNREIDYAQPYAAVDRTAEGWMPPTVDSIARDIADGYDIRYLHSVGPVNLAPGDSITVNWALVISPLVHSAPQWFMLTFDPDNPGLYLSGLGLSGMGLAMTDLRTLWDNSFANLPIRAPVDFRIDGWNDTSGVLSWRPKQTLRLDGYRILRTTRSDPPDGMQVFLPASESTFVDVGLNRSLTYYYTVSSVANGNVIGTTVYVDSLLPDRPLTPFRPHAVGLKNAIALNWDSNDARDIRAYRVYRREESEGWELLAELSGPLGYVDSLVETARPYEYRLTALSALDNESYPSPTSMAAAFAFDGFPQIIDYTDGRPASLTDKDSIAAVWSRLISDAEYRDASNRTAPFALLEFNPHPVTVVVSDGRSPLPSADSPVLDLYSTAHGATIITGRDLFNPDLRLDSLVTLPPGSIGYKAGIRRAYYPRTLLANPTRMNAEFIAAEPADRSLPRLTVDPTRTGWGLNPAMPHPGNAIPFVGYFEIDTALADVLYTFVANDGWASPLHGKPVAVMSKEFGRTLAIFAFPLSYIEETQAQACVTALLERMGYGSTSLAGDADNDGAVTAADVVLLINYLYRGGYLVSEGNADVNGDCRVDVLDLVYMVDYVHRGQEFPTGTCP